ncbi:uncharacterized protein METZ01_LOCUS170387 [marine metagenome]|uniref:Cell division protein FtsQ/DivIB C-terminal domain-containing protein n=1 Tax=marine metagenome TaxID=408172 RepID=A0A382BWU2_9ZZZZ
MKKLQGIPLIFLLFYGCSSSIEDIKFTLFFDHTAISNQEILMTKIPKLINEEKESFINLSPSYKKSWVYAFSAIKKWPNEVEVRVKEHQPLARWKDKGFLTHSGHIIFPEEPFIEMDLINLEGREDQSFVLLDNSRRIQSQLYRLGEILEEVELKQSGYFEAVTLSGMRLIFDQENFRDQLERLESFISFELVSGRNNYIQTVDFRYMNGISVLFSQKEEA